MKTRTRKSKQRTRRDKPSTGAPAPTNDYSELIHKPLDEHAREVFQRRFVELVGEIAGGTLPSRLPPPAKPAPRQEPPPNPETELARKLAREGVAGVVFTRRSDGSGAVAFAADPVPIRTECAAILDVLQVLCEPGWLTCDHLIGYQPEQHIVDQLALLAARRTPRRHDVQPIGIDALRMRICRLRKMLKPKYHHCVQSRRGSRGAEYRFALLLPAQAASPGCGYSVSTTTPKTSRRRVSPVNVPVSSSFRPTGSRGTG